MLPAAKPTMSPSFSATKTLVLFLPAVSTRSHSAVLCSSCMPSRYASGISPRYVLRQDAMRTAAIAGASCGVARRMAIVIASATARNDASDRLRDVADGESEMLEQRGGGRRFAVAVDADDACG